MRLSVESLLRRAAAALFLLVLFGANRLGAATVVVNDPTDTTHNSLLTDCSNSGTGTCSLHDAINYANTAPSGPHTITFSIATVNLSGSLPTITKPMTIDGSFGAPRVDVVGSLAISGFDIESVCGATPCVGVTLENLIIRNMSGDGVSIVDGGNQVLNCVITSNGTNGISITTSASTPLLTFPPDFSGIGFNLIGDPLVPASGNLISGNAAVGVKIFAQRTALNVVAFNKIGTNAAGTAVFPNGSHGVEISGDAFANTIGPGNIISGNNDVNGDGINISGTVLAPNVVTTNIIGPSSLLVTDLHNGRHGISISSTKANVGVADVVELGPANIIGYNGAHGVLITASDKVRVFGNFIGVAEDPSSAGTFLDLGNVLDGIHITTGDHQIGGATIPEKNVISANNNSGISLSGSGTTDVVIQGNIIGRDPLNAINFPNTLDGITITDAGNNTIGGVNPGEPNVIAGNGRNGVKIKSSGNGWANLITHNSIFANHQLVNGMGIDLDHDQEAPDPTDNGSPAIDPNLGYANDAQNAAVISTATYNSGTGETTVNWALDSSLSTPMTLEFFASDAPGFSNHGEGQKYLGTATATTDGVTGHASGPTVVTPSPAYDTRGKYITMTVTPTNVVDPPGPSASGFANNTSEFSNAVIVPDPATHFAVSAPASATAGAAFSFTVTALTASNATDTSYSGTVHFTSSDGAATLPADATLTNGFGTFSATLVTAGNQTITATDTVTASITGTSGPIAVSAAAATHFTVSAPATATAGAAFSFNVTALDSFNNTATTYAGTAHFTSSDGAATLPSNSTLTSGAGTFSATLKTAGTQTITATDTVTPSITGTSNTITVSAGPATHFLVSAPASATAGVPFSFNVTALDAFSNTATSYAGAVHFTSTDGAATLPSDSPLVSGTGIFSATLKTAGSQTITATDTVAASITGTSGTIAVSAAAATHFVVSAPASATAGSAFSFTVTALDTFNNTATTYSGTAHFTSSDGAATLPADSTLTNGQGTFSATLNTAGGQTITATDTVTPSITGTSNTITVSGVAATHFVVSAPASATAGSAFSFTVTAQTAANTTATSYSGTVHFTSSDGGATLPADSTLTNGVGTFSATLVTVGSQTITATDTVTPSITGTSNTITVSAGAATHFAVSAPGSTTASLPFSFTVTALDVFNNIATSYVGTAHFTSTDAAAVLPADSTLTNGTGTFSATLNTPGFATITATDTVTPSITGTSNTIDVAGAGPATHFLVSAPATATTGVAFSFTVTAQDAANATDTSYSGTVHFTSSDGAAVLPADATLTNGVGTFSATLNTIGAQTITATDTVTASITGTSGTITVASAVATHFVVSAPASATAGSAFSFTVTAQTASNATATTYSGIVHFTSSDGLAVLPADSTLTNGVGTFSATLKTAGSQTITATDTVTASITGTSNAILVSAAAATHYAVSAPASALPGVAFNFSVTALDPFNNTATGYAGTVHFTSSDAAAVLPANSTLTNGTGTFSATLNTAGGQTITATDTVTAAITGTSGTITVTTVPATHFVVSAPASATAGAAFSFTVTAQTATNTTATSYSGTVHFTSTDGTAVLPADSTLTNGVGTFSATLKTAGSQTITATDTVTASITGTSNAILVSAGPATHYAVSAPASAAPGVAFNFTVTALDAFNNTATGYAGTVHFTSSDGAAALPANSTLTNGFGTFSATLQTLGNQTITATDTVTSSITGTSGVVAVAGAAAGIPTMSWEALLALILMLGVIGMVTLRSR